VRATTPAASLSVVIPVHDEVRSLPVLHQELTGVLDGLDRAAEIVFAGDGSTDCAHTQRAEVSDNGPT
jgi:hypothetical protein